MYLLTHACMHTHMQECVCMSVYTVCFLNESKDNRGQLRIPYL